MIQSENIAKLLRISAKSPFQPTVGRAALQVPSSSICLPTGLLKICAKTTQIPINSMKIYHVCYADDLVIFSSTKEGLQKSLDITLNLFSKWNLTINNYQSNFSIKEVIKESMSSILMVPLLKMLSRSYKLASTSKAGQAWDS